MDHQFHLPFLLCIVIADPLTPSRKCLAHIPGLVGTNAAFLVPDHIQKKFIDGWNIHIPLTYLTNKGCLLKDRQTARSSQDVLTIDNSSGHILTTSKPLSDDGELNLTFDKWHQAWHRLLDLIKSLIPEEFLLWEQHYLFILNNENHTELWPLYLAYNAEIHKRATQLPIDPSKFSLGIWNDLEARYTAKVYLLVQSNMKSNPSQSGLSNPNNSKNPRDPSNLCIPSRGSSFQNHNNRSSFSDPKSRRCIFCGDYS